MSTQLAKTNAALQYIDAAEEERAYLLGIMAEQLGIPGKDAERQDVQGLIAKAVQRNREYGWEPGVHMHVQSFNQKVKDENNRDTGETIKRYVLVDGEKAWKDSGARWRLDHGLRWQYQRKIMTREEVTEEARSMGYNGEIPQNATGVWCRIIILGEDDKSDPDFPMYSSGTWFGKIKAGTYWNTDGIPTGVTPRDVAIRRADKRAMMQSTLTLMPVDSRTPDERSAMLTQSLQQEARYRSLMPQDTSMRQQFEYEEDGDVMWAVDGRRESTEVEFTNDDSDDISSEKESTDSDGESTEPEKGSTEGEDFSPYAELRHNKDYHMSEGAYEIIEMFNILHADSSRQMSADGYKRLVDLLLEADIVKVGRGTMPIIYFFESLCGEHIGPNLPRVKVGKPMVEAIANDAQKEAMIQVYNAATMIYQEFLEGA